MWNAWGEDAEAEQWSWNEQIGTDEGDIAEVCRRHGKAKYSELLTKKRVYKSIVL